MIIVPIVPAFVLAIYAFAGYLFLFTPGMLVLRLTGQIDKFEPVLLIFALILNALAAALTFASRHTYKTKDTFLGLRRKLWLFTTIVPFVVGVLTSIPMLVLMALE